MSGIWTKICGITQAEDAKAVANLGADAVGLNLYPGSPRVVAVEDCAKIMAPLPSTLRRVALFVNPTAEEVGNAVAIADFDLLQFHGDEPAIFCEQFGLPYMKAIRVRDFDQAEQEMQAYDSAEKILLDRYQEKVPGGTGKTFDWSIARRLVEASDQEIVLAGGLDATNVRLAIELVKPFGVDVSSGVELSPGIKDLVAMKQFIESSKSV